MSQSDVPKPTEERLPHSKCGILSFILPLLSAIVCVAYSIIFLASHNPDECRDCLADFCFIGLYVFVFSVAGFIFASVAAFIFALIALCQPHTRKIFSILGLCLSAPAILFLIYVIIGLLLGR